MHEEFNKLIEAMALGELDKPGRARLYELASADPELAARLRQEEALEAMLANLGPNRAPKGLAAKVFERLDSDPALSDVDISRAVHRTFKRRRTGFPWIPMTYLRWASAAVVLGIVVFEVGLLVMQGRQNQASGIRDLAMVPNGRTHSTPQTFYSYEDAKTVEDTDVNGFGITDSDQQVTRGQIIPEASVRKLSAQKPDNKESVTGETLALGTKMAGTSPAPAQLAVSEDTAPETIPEQQLAKAAPRIESVDSELFRDNTLIPIEDEEPSRLEMAAAASTPPPPIEQGSTTPSESVTRVLATPPLPALERQVALRMPLANASSSSGSTGSRQDGDWFFRSLRDTQEKESPVKQKALTNGEITWKPSGGVSGKAVTLRDVEMAIAVAGGDIVSRERIAGKAEAWKVTARMTPAALTKFLTKYAMTLESSGKLKAGRELEGVAPARGDRQVPYTVIEGKNLLWALGFEGMQPLNRAGDRKTTTTHDLYSVPLDERPKLHDDQKIDVILMLSASEGNAIEGR